MAVKKSFNFKLGDRKCLSESKEEGQIVGRAHYLHAEPQYLIRYRAGDGTQCETWWTESAIEQ